MDFLKKVFSKDSALLVKEKTEKAHHFMATNVFFKHFLLSVLIVIVSIWLSMFMLDVFTHHNEAIHVPDFKGKTFEEAERLADKHDLKVQIIDSIFSSEGVKGSVLEQNPVAFFTVKRNRTIFLTIKTISEKTVRVPDVTHVSKTEAQIELERSGLTVGRIEYINSQYADLVVSQKFKGKIINVGTVLPVMSQIDLVVGRGGGDATSAEVPDLLGLNYSDAVHEIKRTPFGLGSIVYDRAIQTTEDSTSAKVWKQNPEATDINISGSSKIDIWLTNDDSKLKNE